MIFLVICLATFYIDTCLAIAMYASEFNQSISCTNHLILDQTSHLILDQDIVIDQNCQLFELAATFSSTDSLIVSSRKGFSLIITADCDFGTVFFQGHQLVLQGNAQLIITPGVSVTGQDTAIVCTQNSRIKWL